VIDGSVAAVLYGDTSGRDTENDRPAASDWMITTELLARYAARCLETATALTAVRASGGARPEASQSRAPRSVAASTQPANFG
jgi:hypothetical protein